SISVIIEQKAPTSRFREELREFFRFFGEPVPPEDEPETRKSEASGSGVIISEDGYIVTNNHVIEHATEDGITVTTTDRRQHKARLVGTDPLTDLALLKIEGNGYRCAHFGNIDDVRTGEMVFAIGNPLGLNSTVTNGIISAIGRGGLSLMTQRSRYSVEYFIQTDAAINPGNSGGGLFDIKGSLVGINTAIATRTGTYIGYGFAIPVDLVRSVVEDLIEDGDIDRGYIGVQIKPVDETMAKSVGLDEIYGVLVNDVIEDSPAEKAGIEAGDIILELDGDKLTDPSELQSKIVLHRAGDEVGLTIWRDGKKIHKKMTLEKPEEDQQEDIAKGESPEKDEKMSEPNRITFDKLGFTVQKPDEEVLDELGVDGGAYIVATERYSIAAERGLFPGGVIVKAAGKDIESPSDMEKVINNQEPGSAILLQVRYKDVNQMIAIEIPK
ncbi:MAG: trypsin-like peptidase domain-containing protein, partial [Candidatus Kapaibacterium sp.]